MNTRPPLPNPLDPKAAKAFPSAPKKLNPPVASGKINPPQTLPPLPPLPNATQNAPLPGLPARLDAKQLEDFIAGEGTTVEDLENLELVEDSEELDYEPITEEEDVFLGKIFSSSSVPGVQQTLFALARDKDWQVRNAVALNPDCPPALLTLLAQDENDMVRESVLENPATPWETFVSFVHDEDDDIQIALIESPRATAELLVPLHSTDDDFVADALLDSPLVPEDVKNKLRVRFA